MSVKEIHRYKEFNDFTGKSLGARKHSVSFKDAKTNAATGIAKSIKVATLVSIVGLGAATAAVQMETPIVDFSGMQVYMEEQPKWLSDKPTFEQLFGDHVHEWDSGQIIVEATCTEDGSIEFHCKGCNETRNEVVEAKGHTVATVEGKEATCTEDGYTESSECSACGEVLVESNVIAATGHVPVEVEKLEATCTESGHTAGMVCDVCGEGLQDTKVTKALGHKFGKAKVIKKATCTEPGEEQKTCSRCGITENTVIAAKGHKEETISAKSATCVADGRTEGRKCSECGEVFSESTKIPALGHDIEYKFALMEWGASEAGYPSCKRCGANLCEHKEIMEDGDSWDPYCYGEGHVAGTFCYFCGKVFSTGYDIPATGHTAGDGYVYIIDEPTCRSTGTGTTVCLNCGDEFEVELPIDPDYHPSDGRELEYGDPSNPEMPTGAHCKYCGASVPW